MASKILKNFTEKTETIELLEFAESNYGEESYALKTFAAEEEHSVQDLFTATADEDPETIPIVEDIITDFDYLPPSRRLAKAGDDVSFETVPTWNGSSTNTFQESPNFSDALEGEQEYPNKVVTQEGVVDTGLSEEQIKEYTDKIEALEVNKQELELAKQELETKLAELQQELDKKSNELEKQLEAEPAKIEVAKTTSYQDGYNKAKDEANTVYVAEKSDYLSRIEEFNNKSLEEYKKIEATVNEFDTHLHDIVIGFVESIVGAERKFNNQFIVSLINKHLSKLVGLKDVTYSVHPDDIADVKRAFPNNVVSGDTALERGSVSIQTNVGVINLNPQDMVEELTNQINSTVTEGNKSTNE